MAAGPPTSQHHQPYSVGAIAMKQGTPFFVRRLRTPGVNDVLSGRGGSVNQHPGNVKFREWVNERKYDYNLALSKTEKAVICRDVIAKVLAQNPPGKFLGREESATNTSSTSSWWVELNDERIMSKTSQALREGAPKIREEHQQHQQVPAESSKQRSLKRRRVSKYRNALSSGVKASAIGENKYQELFPVHPTMLLTVEQRNNESTRLETKAFSSNVVQTTAHAINKHASSPLEHVPRPSTIYSSVIPKNRSLRQDDCYSDPFHTVYSSKPVVEASSHTNGQYDTLRSGPVTSMDYYGKTILATDETPPLKPQPEPNTSEAVENFQLEAASSTVVTDVTGNGGVMYEHPGKGLKRNHSLASSELGDWSTGSCEFINPFPNEDEEEQLYMTLKNQTSISLASPRLGVFRDSSVSSKGDLGGIGALMRDQHTVQTPNQSTIMALIDQEGQRQNTLFQSQSSSVENRVRSNDYSYIFEDNEKLNSLLSDDDSAGDEPPLWDEDEISNKVPDVPPLDASWGTIDFFNDTFDSLREPVSA